MHGDRLVWQQQLQQSMLAGQQPGKALINSKSDDHENVNIFYEKNWQGHQLNLGMQKFHRSNLNSSHSAQKYFLANLKGSAMTFGQGS